MAMCTLCHVIKKIGNAVVVLRAGKMVCNYCWDIVHGSNMQVLLLSCFGWKFIVSTDFTGQHILHLPVTGAVHNSILRGSIT